jgi:asparagine synthetase B (glutamine-hydrolysing)
MCSIVGSFSKERFKKLITLNQSRGSFSYSLMTINPETLEIIQIVQDFGQFDFDALDKAPDGYHIGHTQAPTGGLVKDPERIHPARYNGKFLFHNGIIKHKDVERLKEEQDTDESWDSKLMLKDIEAKGLEESLNSIDGSFACVYFDGSTIKIFRSAAGILFLGNDMDISSTKFDDAIRIEKDTIYNFDITSGNVNTIDYFISKSAPYFY